MPESTNQTDKSQRIRDVASAIRQRAEAFQRRANLNLVIGILMLIAGVPLFFYSAYFAKLGITSSGGAMTAIEFWAVIVGTTVVRISVVVYMIFVARVFLQLYRTALRFEVFYHSQADALLLIEDTQLNHFGSLAGFLYPDNISTGKLPETPTKELIQLVEKLSAIAGAK